MQKQIMILISEKLITLCYIFVQRNDRELKNPTLFQYKTVCVKILFVLGRSAKQ